MKPYNLKAEFIELRAQGLSYSKVCEKLRIGKSTAISWGKELNSAIEELKQERLGELYELYSMSKEARIKRLGSTLARIDDALEHVDLSEVPPERLLDFKLKYAEALKEEYSGFSLKAKMPDAPSSKDALRAYADLANRVQAGDVTSEQASREASVLSGLVKAIQTTELEERLSTLESLLNSR